MNLKEWRELMGYPLWKVAELAEKKTPQSIDNFEKNGIKTFRQRDLFKKLSKGRITDFEGIK